MEVAEITEKLEQGIRDVYNSDKWREWLDTLSKFHRYSANNSLLIAMQNPAASLVAGYRAWEKNFERHVKKGEVGIQIIAPAPRKVTTRQEKINPDSGEIEIDSEGKPIVETVTIQVPSYRVVTVFDVSQTEGKELPSPTVVLNGAVERYDDYIKALKDVSPVPIEFAEINYDSPEKRMKGYFSSTLHEIKVQEGLGELQTIKTMVHEIAHAMLHDYKGNDIPKEEQLDSHGKEIEAESVAYTVCKHFGLDTSDYSFAYLASWNRDDDMSDLKKSMDTIQRTAAELIDKIEERVMQKDLKKDINNEALQSRSEKDEASQATKDDEISKDYVRRRKKCR